MILQISHDSAACAQAERTAACQNDGMHHLCSHQRIEQLAFSGCRAAAAYIQPCAHAVLAKEYGTAGAGCGILHLPYFNVLNVGYRYLFHGSAPNILLLIIHFIRSKYHMPKIG